MKNETQKIMGSLNPLFYSTIFFVFVVCIIPFVSRAVTFTVTNTNDGGSGSLRQAITNTNITFGNHVIVFNIPGTAPHTITLLSALSSITRSNLVIDGTTQPANGFTGSSPRIILNINSSTRNGLFFSGANSCAVYGLYIQNGQRGINLLGSDNAIIGNSGKGNVLSGNAYGIYVDNGSDGTIIKGNFIGTDVTATADEGNSGDGIFITNSNNTFVGGNASGELNIISGNDGNGITIDGSGTAGTVIKGNYIGTDINGTGDIGNNGSGIVINSTSSSGTLGGNLTGEGNVISGNNMHGIYIVATSATWNNIKGNYIGTDKTGTLPLGNSLDGIHVAMSTSAVVAIGGNSSGDGNVIAANGSDGIELNNATSPAFVIKGNKIGTGVTGTENLGNFQHGILVKTHDVQIGGTTSGDGNSIAFNGLEGVKITGGTSASIRNKMLRNNFYCNSQTTGSGGILLSAGNNNIQAPVITNVDFSTVSGTSEPNSTVEIYKSNAGCVTCEGKEFAGSVVTNSSGNWSFAGNFCSQSFTATATAASKGTSSFSSCNNGLPGNTVLNFIPADDTVSIGTTISFTNLSTGFPVNTIFVWVFQDCFSQQDPVVIPAVSSCADSTAGLTSINHTFLLQGTFSVFLYALDCDGLPFQIPVPVSKLIIVLGNCSPQCDGVCNLVCNGNFEESFIICPTATSQIRNACPWFNPSVGGRFQTATPDFFHSCTTPGIPGTSVDVPNNFAGSQLGNGNSSGYGGIFVFQYGNAVTQNYREYLEAPLEATLIAGKVYRIKLYISLADNSNYAIDRLGIHISSSPVTQNGYQVLPITPSLILQPTAGSMTDKNQWVLLCAQYTAIGGETNLTIGNFSSGNTNIQFLNILNNSLQGWSYYYIDDVSLELYEADAGNDVAICSGSSVQIGTNCHLSNGVYSWTPAAGLSCTNCPNPVASPTTTTTYTVTVTDASNCAPTTTAQVTIDVNPTPAVSVTGTNSGCSTTLGGTASATVTGGKPPFTYSWNTSPVQTARTVTGLSAGTYTVLVTDKNGCSATGSVVIIEITNCPSITPPVTFFGDCEIWVECQFFSDLAVNNRNQFWIDIWPVASGNNAPPTFQYSEACGTDYSVIFINHDPSASHLQQTPITTPNDYINASNVPARCEVNIPEFTGFVRLDLIPNFSYPGDAFFLKDATYNIRYVILDQSIGTWIDVDECVQIENSSTDCLTYRDAASSNTHAKRNLFSSINSDSIQKNKFLIYPNPSDGRYFIQSVKQGSNIPIVIQDLLGKIVYRKVISFTDEQSKNEIDVSFLEKGLYFLKVEHGEVIYITKIINE